MMLKVLRHIKKIAVMPLVVAFMASCQDSKEELIMGGDIMLNTAIDGIGQWMLSREGSSEPIPGKIPETIGVFAEIMEMDHVVFNNQCMYNPDGKEVLTSGIDLTSWIGKKDWPYAPTKAWISGKQYNFYGYSPYSENAEWKSGAAYRTFQMHRIPPLCATEYAVCKYLVTKESGYKPTMTLTHITSRLRFLFAIGEQYDQLRIIRITSIKISDSGSGTPYWECEVKLDKAEPDITVTANPTDIYISNEEIELIAEHESEELLKPGQKLTRTYESFSSAYNLLGFISDTYLTVTYDVYDKTDKLLRQQQTTTNRISLSEFGEFERGKCYDVKILVTPKYLYVLSDNDVPPTSILDVKDTTLTPLYY